MSFQMEVDKNNDVGHPSTYSRKDLTAVLMQLLRQISKFAFLPLKIFA